MEDLPIRIRIADRTYPMRVEPESEAIVREVARLIQERIKQYREAGFKDSQDALAQVAFDCLIEKVKGEQQTQRLQQMVFDRIIQLDRIITPVLTP